MAFLKIKYRCYRGCFTELGMSLSNMDKSEKTEKPTLDKS